MYATIVLFVGIGPSLLIGPDLWPSHRTALRPVNNHGGTFLPLRSAGAYEGARTIEDGREPLKPPIGFIVPTTTQLLARVRREEKNCR
jgi:hypothetical protein